MAHHDLPKPGAIVPIRRKAWKKYLQDNYVQIFRESHQVVMSNPSGIVKVIDPYEEKQFDTIAQAIGYCEGRERDQFTYAKDTTRFHKDGGQQCQRTSQRKSWLQKLLEIFH